MKMFVIGLSALIVSGCASLDVAVNKGADANDAAVDAALFTICYGASVGAIRREFADKADVWLSVCADQFSFSDAHGSLLREGE